MVEAEHASSLQGKHPGKAGVGVLALIIIALAIGGSVWRYLQTAGIASVKGGCFQMGDTFKDPKKPKWAKHARPVHRVCLDDFKMDKYEVTQADYQRVTGNNPSYFKDCSQCPVEQVTWFEAKKYCEQIGKRLPTEAEWEYAAREGGKAVKYGTGGNSMRLTEANYDKGRLERTVPVGRYSSNGLGLYDMSGNVWEWVSDWYGENYYKNSPEWNPKGEPGGKSRVLRGGSWYGSPNNLRASYRNISKPGYRGNGVGFRCSE